MELDSLGVSHAEQELYEVLLRQPDRTLPELVELTTLGRARLLGLLRSLADKGLLTRTQHRPARFAPSPPDIAIELLALRRQQEIERARLAGMAFCDRVRRQTRSAVDSPVEMVHGRAAVGHRFRQIQQLARRELLILDQPPYVVEPDGDQHELWQELRDRGVRHRTIYDRDALGPADRVERLAARGEEARVLVGVPMNLVIADRRVGLAFNGGTEVDPGQEAGANAMLLRSSALLDGLVTLFETLWEQATPLWPHVRDAMDPLSSKDQQLLALLAAGLTDQAIARKLGVALRTVERRVRRMMDGLGARTRFQAGLQAAARGLFGSAADPEDRLSPGNP